MKRKQKSPYRLCIHTDDYTGNFERELVGYCFGVLDGQTEENLDEFDPDDYCKHWFFQDVMARSEKQYYLDLSKDFKDKTGYDDLLNYQQNPLVIQYLFETFQEVDDWEQFTFYYISQYFKDKDKPWNCNCLYVQLDKPLNDIWENIILRRIVKFFNDERIRHEEYGCLQFADWDKRHLISIELIDENDNIIKEYNLSDWDFPVRHDWFKATLPNWDEVEF